MLTLLKKCTSPDKAVAIGQIGKAGYDLWRDGPDAEASATGDAASAEATGHPPGEVEQGCG